MAKKFFVATIHIINLYEKGVHFGASLFITLCFPNSKRHRKSLDKHFFQHNQPAAVAGFDGIKRFSRGL